MDDASPFPRDSQGIGLILLRGLLASLLVLQAGVPTSVDHTLIRAGGSAATAAVLSIGIAAVLVAAGFRTRAICLCVSITYGLIWTAVVKPMSLPLSWEGLASLELCITVIGVAIVCTGPGAYSVDACLYGRREIVIPPAQSRERLANSHRTPFPKSVRRD